MNQAVNYKAYVPVLLVFLSALILRFTYLGYSDYQGDEIQALFLPDKQSPVQFLLDQKKGPVQYLITWGFKGISGNYHNSYITRFPFALAGVLSSVLFYLFIRKITDAATALISLIFFVSNGLFIAFSRIVQYQTVVMLFSLASLYLCYRFYETDRKLYLYLSAAAWCLGLLTHSDAMFMAFPLLSIFITYSLKNKTGFKKAFKTLILPISVSLAVLLGFYIPLILNSSTGTQDYWLGRFTGSITSGVISSTYLFSVYQPVYGLWIYLILGGLGIAGWLLGVLVRTRLSEVPVIKKIAGKVIPYPNDKSGLWIYAGVFLWFVSALLFMEVLTKFPGTHIWTYLLPLTIFMGYGLRILFFTGRPLLVKIPGYIAVTMIFIFLTTQSFWIYVDHTKEYPWEKKKFLIWELGTPRSNYQLSLFGFPYNREYREVAKFIISDGRSEYYSTNDKVSISRYYLPLIKSNDKAGYFIQIRRPQTFTPYTQNKRGAGWMQLNPPLKIFYHDGREVAKVYFVPDTWK